MKSRLFYCFFATVFSLVRTEAVEKDVNNTVTYNTTAPTGADIVNWDTGWGAGGVTGWNYVGTVNGASGVYLGNNWVLSAGHVGAGSFTLGGSPSYTVVAGSAHGIVNPDQTSADLTLFKLTTAPNLPSLIIATSGPTAFSASQAGSSVAMLGYGGSQGETWGLNRVTQTDLSVQVTGYSYTTTDFETAYGTVTISGSSVTNDYQLVVGDSGGGDFVYDPATSAWNLTGVNEAIDQNHNGFMVQLSAYASQINNITNVPEPSSLGLIGLGAMVLIWKTWLNPRFSVSRNIDHQQIGRPGVRDPWS